MEARRDDLSTADLAGDRPRDELREDLRDDQLRDDDLTADLPPDDAAYERAEPVVDVVEPAPEPVPAPAAGQAPPDPAPAEPLLETGDGERYQARWTDIQNGFVDEPRQAVEAADGLVAELMQHLAKSFADERDRLEGQWDRGDDVSTDELRVAFQRYRTFFTRLLST